MASTGSTDFVYGKARALIGAGGLDWLTAPINAMLVTNGYSPQPNTDQYVSAIPSSAILVRDYALTGLGISSTGSAYGTIPSFNALNTSGAQAVALILYSKLSSDAMSPLLYYTSTGPGFPFIGQGFNYTIGYDQTNGGFFQI